MYLCLFSICLRATSLSVFYTVKCHPRKIKLIIIIIIIFDARMTSHKELIQATAFQNHHGRHFANGVMADGFSTVFGHLFPGSVSLYKANL